jgi:hypothetical protein
VIANGYLRLDPQEWVRAVEKRQAALGGFRSISASCLTRQAPVPEER